MGRNALIGISLVLAAAGGPAQTTTRVEPAIIREARRFMDDYARDLLAGDRAVIGRRYSRDGAYSLGWRAKTFEPHAAILANYAGSEWQKPQTFAWDDLSLEPAGADSVVIVGNLRWGSIEGGVPALIAYTALLRRENGELRIRVEHENPVADRKVNR